MTIKHKVIAESNGIKVVQFVYYPTGVIDLSSAEFYNNLENAFQHAISNVVGNNIHSVYSPHSAIARITERIVTIGDVNALA